MVLDTLLELPNSLIKFPYSYPIEPFYNNENVRFVTKWSFKLVYYIRNEAIYIMRVFNTNMKANRILEKKKHIFTLRTFCFICLKKFFL